MSSSRVALAGRAQERQVRLLVAGQHVRLEAVTIADGIGELLAVGGVADRAREHRLGRVGVVLVDQLAVLVERVVYALHRVVAQPSVGVDAGAKPGDVAAALGLVDDLAVFDRCDQQPRRVRPDVDDRRALHVGGGYPPAATGSRSSARTSSGCGAGASCVLDSRTFGIPNSATAAPAAAISAEIRKANWKPLVRA